MRHFNCYPLFLLSVITVHVSKDTHSQSMTHDIDFKRLSVMYFEKLQAVVYFRLKKKKKTETPTLTLTLTQQMLNTSQLK